MIPEPENFSLQREKSVLTITTEHGTRTIRTVIIDGKVFERKKKDV